MNANNSKYPYSYFKERAPQLWSGYDRVCWYRHHAQLQGAMLAQGFHWLVKVTEAFFDPIGWTCPLCR